MTRRLCAFLVSVMMLSGCASAIDSSFQEVTLKTPGTDSAHCRLDNGVAVWQVYSNQTIQIQRNDRDIKLDCYAPGNRGVSTVIDRGINEWTIANIVNGVVPGVTYDHFSGALYDYPKIITVNFGSAGMSGFPLPDYQTSYHQKPSEQGIENYDSTIIKKKGEEREVAPPLRKMDMNEIRSRSHPLGGDAVSRGGF